MNSADPAAVQYRAMKAASNSFWAAHMPSLEDDIELVIADLHRVTGLTARAIEGALFGFLRLAEMPCLSLVQEDTQVLDRTYVAAIDECLCLVTDAAVLAEIDYRLARYLTARTPNQDFPSVSRVRRRIREIIRQLLPDESEKDPPDSPAEPKVWVNHQDDGTSLVEIILPTDRAVEFDELLRTRARALGGSKIDAFLDILASTTVTSVTLNVYRAHDVPDAPAFIFGAGWLNAAVSRRLAERVTKVRDMDEVADKTSRAYHTPDDIRAYVTGRDGTCRMPGHNRRADTCQMDHVAEFDAGGRTRASNIESLCQRHHNMKTDGRVMTVMFEDGVILWLFADGRWETTEPEGPLAPRQRRWVRTFGQRMAGRRAPSFA
ncbi:HNH endonuclease signature motif containing protein [Corynebacterium uterequi]|uniref:HNH endonuclease signature motif containing protein n=1 Tax=Corynebacterium uterequi TaxID=1072256 RepID=UPI0011876C77|nr:HNH endonuclease signature motif containing protein [Corynebacterium uterequi]